MLTSIQQELAALYRLEHAFDVNSFVLKRSEVDAPLDRPEQLLVREDGDTLELALVLEDRLLDPNTDWSLDGFCTAAEGVSHLLYLALAAEREAQVSQLELELQAEIDKFVLLLFGSAMSALDVIRRLFRSFVIRDDVHCTVERDRYERANRLALRYCSYLNDRYVAHGRTEPLLTDLRKMYRMGGAQKLDYLSECRP